MGPEKGEKHTSKKQPEGAAADLAFDGIEALVGGLFVHAEGDGDVSGLAKCGVLRCVMAFAEVIHGIADSFR